MPGLPPYGGDGAPAPVRKNLLRVLHAAERIFLGPLTPSVRTPSEVVLWWEKCTLLRYKGRAPRKWRVPVLIIPPLMVTPTIFDLRPGHSLIRFLLDEGFDVFVLDFGVPGREDQEVSIEDYVFDYIPQGINRARQLSGSDDVSLFGWSMGGILSLVSTALLAGRSHVGNLVVLGSPVDYRGMQPFHFLAGFGDWAINLITDRFGNVPPFLSRAGFRIIQPVGSILRTADLIRNYWDREWVAAYESVSQWIGGFIDYPGAAFRQFAFDFIRDDKLRQKKLEVGGEVVDLGAIECPLLVFSGTEDVLAPVGSTEPLLDLVSSGDKEALRAPVGHIGLVAGSKSQEVIWRPVARWLKSRSLSIRAREGSRKRHAPPRTAPA